MQKEICTVCGANILCGYHVELCKVIKSHERTINALSESLDKVEDVLIKLGYMKEFRP